MPTGYRLGLRRPWLTMGLLSFLTGCGGAGLPDGTPLALPTGEFATAVAVTADGKTILTVGEASEAGALVRQYRRWDAATGQLRSSAKTAEAGRISLLAVASAGEPIIESRDGRAEVVIRAADSKTLHTVVLTLPLPDQPSDPVAEAGVSVTELALSPDGKTIAVAVHGSTPKQRFWSGVLWVDATAGTVVGSSALPAGERCGGAAFSPDGKSLAVVGGSQVLLFDATTRTSRVLASEAASPPGSAQLGPVIWSPDSGRVALGRLDGAVGSVVIHDVVGKAEPTRLAVGGSVSRLSWSADGRLAAVHAERDASLGAAVANPVSPTSKYTLTVWSLSVAGAATSGTAPSSKSFESAERICGLAFLADGRLVVCDGRVRLLPAELGR